MREQQESFQREARRLERLAAVLPDVAARCLALERLAILGDVVKLPEEATASRNAAETQLRQAESARNDAADNIAQLQVELDTISLPQTLLQEGGSIEALYYSLGAFRAAREAIASANGRITLAGAQAGSLLTAIGESLRDDLRTLIPSPTLRARVQSLITKEVKLQANLTAACRGQATALKELDELDGEIAELGPQQVPSSLVEALKAFEAQDNPETKAEDLNRQCVSSESTLVRDAAHLTDGTLESLATMGTPLPAELQRFRAAREDLEARKLSLRDKIETIENDIAAVNGELEGLLLQGEVSTAEHLAEQRAFRDNLWQKICHKLFPDAGRQSAGEAMPNPGEYELAVQAADATADSRFTDAARVTQHAGLLKHLAQKRNAIGLERGRMEDNENESKELKLQWQALIDKLGLPSLGISEFGDWLAKRDVFLQRHQSYSDMQGQVREAADRAATMRTTLSAALCEAGLPACGSKETLAQAVVRARALVDQANHAATSQKVLAGKKNKAEKKLADAEKQVAECNTLLDAWRSTWSEAMSAIRLADDAVSEEANARLGQFEDLEDALDLLDSARAELATAQATVARVEQELDRLCEATGYVRANRPADAVADTFYERLGEAKSLARHCQTLKDRIEEAGKAREQADRSMRMAEQELSRLMSTAKCETLPELLEAESQSAECLKLERDIAAIEARLVTSSALPLRALLAQAEGQDILQVEASLQRASGDFDACTGQVETLHGKLIEAKGALGKIDGEAAAADAEQRAADAAARLSNLIADYSSVRLASVILAEAIESYQQRHQGPLLARASELFAAITCGRFVKVATDFDEDMTILVGIRPNGKRETVGSLSSGTRDQLFLALRLAAIESHVAFQEPMPVVVDDIVINFDDAATGATFKVLAELSKKTQVLFFTHHEHLLERATSAIGAESFTAHKL